MNEERLYTAKLCSGSRKTYILLIPVYFGKKKSLTIIFRQYHLLQQNIYTVIHFSPNNCFLFSYSYTFFVAVVDAFLTLIRFVAGFGIFRSGCDYSILVFLCRKLYISRHHGDLLLICPFLLNWTESMSAYPETPG